MERSLDPALVGRLVREALAEDHADKDVTTSALVPASQRGRATFVVKAHGVVAGLELARQTFAGVDPAVGWTALKADGDRVGPGDRLATVEGPLGAILRAERVSLNFLCHLSGVASATAAVVSLLSGTRCRLRDTRKTLPGLRAVQKYATAVGGAVNHRLDLADGILVKDNHLAALRARGLGIADAVRLVRAATPGLKVEVEVTSLDEAREAATAGADELLLDNMAPAEAERVVQALGRERPLLEASGGITAKNARAYAEAGVDFISIGAITHSAPALDISLDVDIK